jgi:hypothetical protein
MDIEKRRPMDSALNFIKEQYIKFSIVVCKLMGWIK